MSRKSAFRYPSVFCLCSHKHRPQSTTSRTHKTTKGFKWETACITITTKFLITTISCNSHYTRCAHLPLCFFVCICSILIHTCTRTHHLLWQAIPQPQTPCVVIPEKNNKRKERGCERNNDEEQHRVFIFEQNEYFSETDLRFVRDLSRGVTVTLFVCARCRQ